MERDLVRGFCPSKLMAAGDQLQVHFLTIAKYFVLDLRLEPQTLVGFPGSDRVACSADAVGI